MKTTSQVLRFVRRFVGLMSLGLILASGQLVVAKDPIARGVFPREVSPQPLAPRAGTPSSHLAMIRLSERWFATRLGGEIVEESDVDQVILNTHVRGTARTTATPAMKLQDDPQRAAIQIVFTGVTHSKTVGRNGPAILYSRSQTQFTATKQVVFTPGHGFEAQPAQVAAKTETFTDDIQSTRRGRIGGLIVRSAWKKVAESKPLSTEIARQNATERIGAALDRKIDGLLIEWNRAADLRETLALVRKGDGSPGYNCRSTKNYVEFALTGDRQNDHLAASPPNLSNFDAPIQVWIHRSLVPTQLFPAIAQVQATQSNARDTLSRLGRVVPVSLPWSPADSPRASPEPNALRTNALTYQFVEDWTVLSLPAKGDNPVAEVKYQQ